MVDLWDESFDTNPHIIKIKTVVSDRKAWAPTLNYEENINLYNLPC